MPLEERGPSRPGHLCGRGAAFGVRSRDLAALPGEPRGRRVRESSGPPWLPLPCRPPAPRTLLDHFLRPGQVFAPRSLAEPGYNTGRRPCLGIGTVSEDELSAPGSGQFLWVPDSISPSPQPDLPLTFQAMVGLGALGPRIYRAAPDPFPSVLLEIRRGHDLLGWLDFVFATYFHSRRTQNKWG